MPPSMQIDHSGITVYENLETQTKRSQILFTESDAVIFRKGDTEASIRLTNVALPISNSDVTNKQYVDAAIMGLSFKSPVRVVATETGILNTDFVAGRSVDGVQLAVNDRILLMGQINRIENGLWLVGANGLTRPIDFLDGASASGSYIFVDEGTAHKDRGFVCTTNHLVGSTVSDIIGTHELEFVQFSARSTAMAGKGLVTGEAEQLDVNVDENTLTVIADVVQLKNLGITNAKIAESTVENSKLVNPNVKVVTNRGLIGGKQVDLGDTLSVSVDHTVVPDLAATNTFAEANTFQGAITVNSTANITGTVTAPRLTGLTTSDIADDSDAVNKAYVTAAVNSATQGAAVRAAAVGENVNIATLKAGSIVDGVVLEAGNRVLLTSQTSAIENGIYTVANGVGAVRTQDLLNGARAAAMSLAVQEGTRFADRVFLCTSNNNTDVVGTHPLSFTYVSQSLTQAAGVSLSHNLISAALDVNTDNVTVETDGAFNHLRLKDLGITNPKIAEATIENSKLKNPNVTVVTKRGLTGGQLINLGDTVEVSLDHSVVPDLAASNTFTTANTFQGTVTISSTDNATSQITGALVVNGGLGVKRDFYCQNSYNMSDKTLKDDIIAIGNALEMVEKMQGCEFTWNEHAANHDALRVGTRTVGVIAQEVRDAGAVLCVTENPESKLLAVDYTKLVPYLIESCKELSSSVKNLKRRCDDLETEVAKRARIE